MTIEPHNAFTVHIRAVMPPKPAPKVLTPALSMQADAKRCSARLRRVMGATQDGGPGLAANMRRMVEAAKRQEAIAADVLALIGAGEMRRTEIERALNLTGNQSRAVMTALKMDGRATFRKGPGGVAIWRAAK